MSYSTEDCEMVYLRMKDRLMEKISQEIREEVRRERAAEKKQAIIDAVAAEEFRKSIIRNNEVE